MDVVANILIGVVGSLIAAALFPALVNFLGEFLLRSFGWFPFGRKVDLRGKWKSTWHVESNRFPEAVSCDDVNVKQLGSRIYARFKVGAVDFAARGTIDSGRYVTGTWKDNTEGGYHGAFQLIIDPNSRDMSGLWIGFSITGTVKQGAWNWERERDQANAS